MSTVSLKSLIVGVFLVASVSVISATAQEMVGCKQENQREQVVCIKVFTLKHADAENTKEIVNELFVGQRFDETDSNPGACLHPRWLPI